LPSANRQRAPLRTAPAQPVVNGLSPAEADAARIAAAVNLAQALRDGVHPADPALRALLEALQRDRPELYQRAVDQIVADFFASANRTGYARALLTSTNGASRIAEDLYARIGPASDLPEGEPLTTAELAALGADLTSADLDALPRPAVCDIAAVLREVAIESNASRASIDAAVRARVSLLKTYPGGDVREADQDALAQDMRFAFGPRDTLDFDIVDRAVPPDVRLDLQRTMLTRAETLLEGGDVVNAARVSDALAQADAIDPTDRARLQGLITRTMAVRDAGSNSLVDPVTVRDTPEAPLPWLGDGLATFLHSNAGDLAMHLIADTPDIPTPLAATFHDRLVAAITANIERGNGASRAITLDVRDANGDHRVYTYDLESYRSTKKKGESSSPHLHAAGLRFASEAGAARLAAIHTREDALAYADRVIETVARERIADTYMPLTDSQRVAIRDGIVGWLNLATHHGMPVNPVLRVIDEAQRVASVNRAININLETGREQKVWGNGKYDRLSGLTSSTRHGDIDGDGHMDFFSNIINRRAFELGFFNLHLYRGKHGRTLQQDGVNPRFQSQWDPQLAATHVASYVRRGPPVVSGPSHMCDAIEDNAASRSAIVDFDGAMVLRHSLSDNGGVAKRWRPNVRRHDYTGKIWHANDAALGWGPVPDYTPTPKSVYPDLVQQAMKS
jgi:hypothetical protein